jgi:hypothetical protein
VPAGEQSNEELDLRASVLTDPGSLERFAGV